MISTRELSETRRRAVEALTAAFRAQAEGVDERGYTSSLEDNLVDGLTPENLAALRQELGGAAGGELEGKRPKICAAYSSAALAANTFARWRNDETDLRLLAVAREGAFDSLTLEGKFPTRLRGTPPHLDVVLQSDRRALAVESKCLEHLSGRQAKFAKSAKPLVDRIASPAWAAKFERLIENPSAYQQLDVAQLVKHYLGLKSWTRKVDGRQVRLLYLYWEPADASRHAAFAEHRRELQEFAAGLESADVPLLSMTYRELWSEWEQLDPRPAWLTEHLDRLRRRYDVTVG
jgi:hypothetical protein